MKIHVLAGHNNVYTCICHGTTPAGNNSAGLLWSDVVKAALKPVSVLSVGSGPGQTTQAEIDGIAAGTILETQIQFFDDPALTTTQRNANLDALATQTLADLQTGLAGDLKWYGAFRT